MDTKPEWFAETAGFFGPNYLTEYHEELPEERTLAEVDFIEKALGLKPSSDIEILDVPCGHGRHTIELAERGYLMTGSDLNSFFLATAELEARKKGLPITWHQADMRELSYQEEFQVVLNLFTAMGYFEDDREDEKFFRSVHSALVPGGRFMVDYMNSVRLLRGYSPNGWRTLVDGSRLLLTRELDLQRGVNIDRRLTIRPNGSEVTNELKLRLYMPHELIAMGERVGFVLKDTYGDFTGRPLTMDAKRLILVFEKPS